MKKYTITFVLAGLLVLAPQFTLAQIQGDVGPTPNQNSCVMLRSDLSYRSTDALTGGEVSQLQDFLQSKGYLNSEPTGYFGLLTQAAVKRFQTASGILSYGYVGPVTRGKIQAASCGGVSTNPTPSPLPDGCRPGDLFSPTTGQRCNAAVACTMEVKVCPDGSYVGRQAPFCAFAACPASSSVPSLTVVYPNGGEKFAPPGAKDVDIRTTWTSSNLSGNVNVFLQNRGGGVCTVGTVPVSAGTYPIVLGTHYTCPNNAAFVVEPGPYKVFVAMDLPNGGSTRPGYSDSSDNFFTIADSITLTPYVAGTFAYRQMTGLTYERGYLQATYNYGINGYNKDLVLDVEPTVNCNDTYISPLKRDCSAYHFDLSGKAAESYIGVGGDPYVKGGAQYRFTGLDGGLILTGYVYKTYATPVGYVDPVPDSVDFKFILRDINGGPDLWTETKRVQFKG